MYVRDGQCDGGEGKGREARGGNHVISTPELLGVKGRVLILAHLGYCFFCLLPIDFWAFFGVIERTRRAWQR